jgi:hypothetical protein
MLKEIFKYDINQDREPSYGLKDATDVPYQ